MPRPLQAEVGEVLHGAAAEFLAAEAAQVFLADAGDAGEIGEGPGFGEVGLDALPEPPEAVVWMPWLGEADDVVVDEFRPMMERGGGG